MRDIRNITTQTKNIKDAPKFGEISCKDKYGRETTIFSMDKNAFTLLVMGYSGAKAMQFKIDYINALSDTQWNTDKHRLDGLIRTLSVLICYIRIPNE